MSTDEIINHTKLAIAAQASPDAPTAADRIRAALGTSPACRHDVVSFGTAGAPASRCTRCHRTWAALASMVRDDTPPGPPCPCDACTTAGGR